MSWIKNIEFKNFRVYKKQEFEINPNARIILIHGNNGLGKTSFFDGIEWGLTGNIQRYDKASKEKNEYDVLRNTLADKEEDSYVKLTFDDDQVLKRSVIYVSNKDYNTGHLKSDFKIDEKLVSDDYRGKIKFEESFCFSQFLSQELIDRFIREMKDTDRYTSIRNILGLHRYEKYETFIEKVNTEAISRAKVLTESESNLLNKIEVANAKKTNITLNEEILKLCYVRYFGEYFQEIESNKIVQQIDNEILKKMGTYNNLDTEIRSLNQATIDLEELNEEKFNNFSKNEVSLISIRNNINRNKEIISHIKKYDEIKYLNDNIKEYLNIVSLKGENDRIRNDYEIKNERFSKIKSANRDIKSIMNFFQLNNMYLEDIDKYRKALSYVENLNNSISNKHIELERMMSFKQEFVNTTLKYLKTNVKLEKCPVCKQSFNLEEAINYLNKELESNSDITINTIIRELNQQEKELETYKNEKVQLEQKLILEFRNMQNKLEQEIINIHEKINAIHKNEAVEKEYLIRLSKYGTEIDKISTEYNKYDIFVKGLGENKEKELFLGLIKNLEENQLELTNEIGHFKKKLEKYDVKNYDEVRSKLDELKLKVDNLNSDMNKEKIQINELKELSSFYNNNIQDNNLKQLNYELVKVRSELKKINTISKSFELMNENSREVLLNEIDRIFKSDDLPIKILYNYLNPNYNFDKLNFRIDNSNPKNNRLILEAISENGAVINPAYSFSSAQNNVLAVSIFLSFALTQKWSNLDCIFMDDPIQNMDDINVNNFVDIIRNIIRTTNKQIFISTHDIRIYEFMKNKFGNHTQLFNFIDYGSKVQGR
ncbi:AAA family ATPase [Candidatus Clostridium radicumherbarum]|uniref:Nuclease SbcCD subunit C n=1 Tax=Candidatus Clostridium radicumherbarum TaxID=3381662 RepID=A0ABW8TMM9_9CLOT